MPQYIVNKNSQPNGDNEVHKYPRSLCNKHDYPSPSNQVSLGTHLSCHGAVRRAKELGYRRANGCYYCATECHTT